MHCNHTMNQNNRKPSVYKTFVKQTTTSAESLSSVPSSSVSRKDNQMAAVLELKNAATRLIDAKNEITNLIENLLSDPKKFD